MSAGKVLYNVLNNNSPAKAELIDTKIKIKQKSENLFIAETGIELRNNTGEIDVHYYDIYAVNKGGWKIYKLKEVEPDVTTSGELSKEDIEKAQETFKNYLDSLLNNNYKQATVYLVGPAKRAHLETLHLLEGKNIIKKLEKITFKPLASGEKTLVLQSDYTADGRKISVIITLYRTVEGWMIYNVTQT